MTWKRVVTAAVLIPFVVGLVLWGSTAMLSLGVAVPVCMEVFRRAAHHPGHIVSVRPWDCGVDAIHQAADGGSAARGGNQLQRVDSCGVSFVVYDPAPRLALARPAAVAFCVGDHVGR